MGYWLIGNEDWSDVEYVDTEECDLYEKDEGEVNDRLQMGLAPAMPKWAEKAGRIMHAILLPETKHAGWQAFEIVDALAKSGQRFAQQVRQGIARIARSLQMR